MTQAWNAWAKRWGKSWGYSWGPIEDAQQRPIGGGGQVRGRHDPLIDQVLDKWAYIEEAQRRDKPDEAPIREVAKPDVPEADFGKMESAPAEVAGPNPALGMPFVLPGFNAAPVPPLTVPLGPDLAERARKARERDDEQALLLILSQVL